MNSIVYILYSDLFLQKFQHPVPLHLSPLHVFIVSVVCSVCEKAEVRWRGVYTAEQGPVEGELLGQVLDVSDALVHGPREMISMVQAAQDDA